MLQSILYDILDQDETFFYHRFQTEYRHLATLRERGDSDLVEQEYKSLKELLLSLSYHSLAKRLYLIIDAVDESNDRDRRDILELLFNLSQTKYCVVKIFVASRPVTLLDRNISKFNFIRLQDKTKSDISNFAQSFLNRLGFANYFIEKAAKYIVENAQGVFLWVKLVGEELLQYDAEECAAEEVFTFLKSLPTGLEEFYERMLSKIGMKPAEYRDAIKMFQVVLFACRPLLVSELLHAVGIQDNLDTPSDESFKERIPPEGRIIVCGGNFLEIRQHHGTTTSYKNSSNL
jgi:hypothetical protein